MSETFLGRAAARILEFCGDEPETVAVVLPSQRAAVYFRKHLSEQVARIQFTPQLLTLDTFVGDFTPLESADQIELLFLLYKSYSEIWKSDAEPFDRFLKWAPLALADFSEVDAYMVDPVVFFRDLTNLKELDEWSLNAEELTPTQQNYAWFWKKLGELYFHFSKTLKEANLAYSGMLFRNAAENLENPGVEFKYRHVFFCGFNALSRSEEKIMQHFVQSGNAEMLWDADKFYIDFPQHEAGMFLRNNFKQFDGAQNWIGDALGNQEKSITIAATPNEVAQTDLMAELLKQMPDRTQTAVVLANENLLSPVLNAIPEAVDRVNVTMGFSIRYSPLHSLFDLLFEWLNARTEDGRYYYRHVLRLVKHPYLQFSADFAKASEKLVSAIKEQNRVFLSPEEIQTLTGHALLKEFFTTISCTDLSAANQLKAQLNLVNFIAQTLGSSGEQTIEKEYIFQYLKILRRIEQLVERYPNELSGEAYARIFAALTAQDKLNFVGEPLEGVQVMGMLETRALDFKNLIILSCNEHVMPGNNTRQSLIPFDLKKHYHLPTRTEKEAIYAYYFYRLLQRAENVHLVYSTDTSSWQGAEPSRYLAQLQYDLKDHKNIRLRKIITRTEERSKAKDPLAILKSEEVVNRIAEKIQRGLSPSALNKYLHCPLDFYYSYVLGYREEDEIEETIEHSTLGTVVHDVLEMLYTPHIKQGVLKVDDLKAMFPKIKEAMRAQFDKEHSPDSTKYGMNNLIFEVAVQFVERFLKKEMETIRAMEAQNEYVQILSLEEPLTYRFTIESSNREIEVKILGKADRIDQVGNTIRVVDYKTGKVLAKDLKLAAPEEELAGSEKSKALQLLMYGLMYQRQSGTTSPVTAANVSMRNLSQLLIPVSWKGNEALGSDDWNDFEGILKDIVASMLDHHEPLQHNPEAKYCRFCELKTK